MIFDNESGTSGVGGGQRSRFLAQTRRIAASGDEIDFCFEFVADVTLR